jgi:hypothetical protein
MMYGDGGAGKTTLAIDLACHLAAGDDWFGMPIPRPVRVLLIEREGPRPLMRRKLRRKLEGWQGSELGDRLLVWEAPWATFTFAHYEARAELAEKIAELEIDVVIVGPLNRIGMDEAGTLQEVRNFTLLVAETRQLAGRKVAIMLVHHENKGGKVSGAWEGAGDTLLHVQAQGHGQTRLYVQKARWASSYHATALQLRWTDREGFELAEPEQAGRPERVWNDIADYVLAHGGCSWNDVEDEVAGEGTYKRRRRDAMLEEGLLINTGGKRGFKLWHRDDPARPTLDTEVRRTTDAPADAPASGTGDGAVTGGASVRRSLKADAPTDAPGSASPDDDAGDEPAA